MKEYKVIHSDNANSSSITMTRLAKNGWRLNQFEYKEYTHNIKGEGPTVLQSYVAVMERDYEPPEVTC